jgi:fructose-1,6-bisphosphatase/inositol monophosphatase family enzyme
LSNTVELGLINDHIVGRVLKETVRRATAVIRSERAVFEAHTKEGYSGSMDDVFTSADTKAQEVYMKTFSECFPDCGVIAEEDNLVIPSKTKDLVYFTVDPLDGTKAFVRRQSHGVGTMVALVRNGIALSAYVGDINTEETYGYRPGSPYVHRITRLDTFERLMFHSPYGKNRYVLLRDPVSVLSPLSQMLIAQRFGSHLIDGGSIGVWMARLWKREVAAAILSPSWETPWDSSPVIGISKKLGYVFLRPDRHKKAWIAYDPMCMTEKYHREHDSLVVHEEDLRAVMQTF